MERLSTIRSEVSEIAGSVDEVSVFLTEQMVSFEQLSTIAAQMAKAIDNIDAALVHMLAERFALRGAPFPHFEARSLPELEARIGEAEVLVVSGLWRNTLPALAPRLQLEQPTPAREALGLRAVIDGLLPSTTAPATVIGAVPAVAVSDLLNELRNVGAEAVSVGGVRVVAGTVVAGPSGALAIENTALGEQLEITALGSPAALTGALTRMGGIVAQLRATYEEVAIEVTPLERVELPATERSLAPNLGQPRG